MSSVFEKGSPGAPRELLRYSFKYQFKYLCQKRMTNGFEKGPPGAGEFLKYSPRVDRQAAVDVGSV